MNDNYSSAFRNARATILGIHHLRLVWSARLRRVGPGVSPWERLHDRLLWLGFIAWLRQDVQSEKSGQQEKDVQSEKDAPR